MRQPRGGFSAWLSTLRQLVGLARLIELEAPRNEESPTGKPVPGCPREATTRNQERDAMKVTFALSQRQRKELLERGRVLRLVLPDDEMIPDEELPEHVRQVLDVPPAWVKSVTTGSVTVRPELTPSPMLSGASVYGRIVHDDSTCRPGTGAIVVSVLHVDVAAIDKPRGRTKWQWPGRVVVAGEGGTDP